MEWRKYGEAENSIPPKLRLRGYMSQFMKS